MEPVERTGGRKPLVWYAAYGSNLWSIRFACYLEGGTAPGSTGRPHGGARDPSPPRADRVLRLPHRVVFAGRAASWGGGGVAFLDHAVAEGDARAWGRAWLVTVEQLADVVAQENGWSAGEVDLGRDLGVDPLDLAPGSVVPLTAMAGSDAHAVLEPGDGPPGVLGYRGILALEPIEGIPVLTCTAARPVDPSTWNPPSDAYRATLAAGLAECTDLAPSAIDAYLDALWPGTS